MNLAQLTMYRIIGAFLNGVKCLHVDILKCHVVI